MKSKQHLADAVQLARLRLQLVFVASNDAIGAAVDHEVVPSTISCLVEKSEIFSKQLAIFPDHKPLTCKPPSSSATNLDLEIHL